eukprot:4579905-Pyramimonas_sp.AAC.1
MGKPRGERPPARCRGGALRAMRVEPAVRHGPSLRHPSAGPEEPRGGGMVAASHRRRARDYPTRPWRGRRTCASRRLQRARRHDQTRAIRALRQG